MNCHLFTHLTHYPLLSLHVFTQHPSFHSHHLFQSCLTVFPLKDVPSVIRSLFLFFFFFLVEMQWSEYDRKTHEGSFKGHGENRKKKNMGETFVSSFARHNAAHKGSENLPPQRPQVVRQNKALGWVWHIIGGKVTRLPQRWSKERLCLRVWGALLFVTVCEKESILLHLTIGFTDLESKHGKGQKTCLFSFFKRHRAVILGKLSRFYE